MQNNTWEYETVLLRPSEYIGMFLTSSAACMHCHAKQVTCMLLQPTCMSTCNNTSLATNLLSVVWLITVCQSVCVFLQEETRHQAIVVKALYQAMNVLTPGKLFLGRKQVTQIAEKRPRTLEAFMTMSLCGLSSNTRCAHGHAIMES